MLKTRCPWSSPIQPSDFVPLPATPPAAAVCLEPSRLWLLSNQHDQVPSWEKYCISYLRNAHFFLLAHLGENTRINVELKPRWPQILKVHIWKQTERELQRGCVSKTNLTSKTICSGMRMYDYSEGTDKVSELLSQLSIFSFLSILHCSEFFSFFVCGLDPRKSLLQGRWQRYRKELQSHLVATCSNCIYRASQNGWLTPIQ